MGDTHIVKSEISVELTSTLIDDYREPIKTKGFTINHIIEDYSKVSSIEFLGGFDNIGFINNGSPIIEKTIINGKNI